MARRGTKSGWRILLFLAALAVIWITEFDLPKKSGSGSGEPTSFGFEKFEGCQLVTHRQNDGDSFRVRLPDGRVEQFRLYFVDAPESDFRTYKGGRDNHDRIRDQAKALGLPDPAAAVEVGKAAKTRTLALLDSAPFTIHTRWDDPFGDRRYHAFVSPSRGPWLHETLVRDGLVRIHTKGSDLPDGTRQKEQLKKLRSLEEEARRGGRGAWGGRGGSHRTR